MKNITIKKLQESFNGKICTILTKTVAKTNFQDQQFADFFTGLVESIDEDGIFTRHHITNCLNFYPMEQIVGILEEQVIMETDPSYKELIEEIKQAPQKQKDTQIEQQKNDSKFINPDFMTILAQNAKKSQER